MKCILCDRCKSIIDDPKKSRVITCSRPITRNHAEGHVWTTYWNEDGSHDIIWTKELCPACAAEFEEFANPTSPTDTEDGNA